MLLGSSSDLRALNHFVIDVNSRFRKPGAVKFDIDVCARVVSSLGNVHRLGMKGRARQKACVEGAAILGRMSAV